MDEWKIIVEDLKVSAEIQRFSSEQERVRIGRDPLYNDLVIDAPEVSRRHALLFLRDDALFIEDLKSKNGTLISIDGRWVRLQGRDRLLIPAEVNLGKRFVLKVDYVSTDQTMTFHTLRKKDKAAAGNTQPMVEETLMADGSMTPSVPPVDPPAPVAAPAASPAPVAAPAAPPPSAAPVASSSSPFALVPGSMIDRYAVRAALGQGGFGITYLAEDVKLKRQVAIKEFFPMGLAIRRPGERGLLVEGEGAREFKEGLERFLREGQILAQLIHPNLVQVQNYFEANGTAYMVMSYEQGHSLESLIAPRKRMVEAWVLRILHPLLDGLAKVHDLGLIHRDIKPANIYIRSNGNPVLLDFGAARQSMGTRSMTSLFTPGYAPLEQYGTDVKQQGPWCDIYALGAVCYRLMTGVPPLDAQTRAANVMMGQPDPLPSLDRLVADRYSPALRRAVLHALAVNPRQRPEHVAAWRGMLPKEIPL